MQADGAGLGRFFSLVKALVLTVQNIIGDVGIHLPAVYGVSLLDVDHKELYAVVVLVV